MANSDVKLKHKVQLRKKVEEPEVRDIGTNPTPTPNEPKSKAWLREHLNVIVLGVIGLGIIVLGVIGYMHFSKSNDKVAETSEQEIETVAEPSVPADTIAVEETDIEEEVSNNGNEATNVPKTKSSEAVEIPATRDNTANVSSSSQANEPNISNDVEAEAMKVIRGDYGVGQERKDKLGNKYQPIQSRVNEMKREGVF